jgi:flagellar biosynthesis anti-sigma factor FlgM
MSDIKSVNQAYGQQLYANQSTASSSNVTEVSETKPVDQQRSQRQDDRVTLSGQSRNMQIAMEEAKSIPSEEEWQQKVEQLRQDVSVGRYEVNAEEVAEKMLGAVINGYA